MAEQRLLDPALPDAEFVTLLEGPISVLYSSTSEAERNAAQALLTQIQDAPNAWLRVDKVLDAPSASVGAKFFALQILDALIRYRWKALPRETASSIRNYVVNAVIKLSSTEEQLQRQRVFVGKLNLILVQVVKQEWPQRWPKFIEELVGASRRSVSLCENNMQILQLLSEEVFDFSSGVMTQERIDALKTQFNDDFKRVFELCQYVFSSAQDLITTHPALLVATLNTLERFLSWIPLGFIFETRLIESLVEFMAAPALRYATLRCLREVASLSIAHMYDDRFLLLFMSFMKQLVVVLPRGTDIAAAYDDSTDDTDQGFIMDLALFLTGFFKSHLNLVDDPNSSEEVLEALRVAHEYLVKISTVSDVEVFKTCLDWWFRLASDLYDNECHIAGNTNRTRTLLMNSPADGKVAPLPSGGVSSPRRSFYSPILAEVRRVMIGRMAKPEEVLIVEDDNGEIVREVTKDTDAIALYKTMRETLVFLTHLDTTNTEDIMLSKLSRQIDQSEWSWSNLNTLCWAIGSISGAMGEEEERKFLVTVIKELLHLVEIKAGKDNRAVVASNIMYVVGQYPRFLRAHWKFLKTVINKLFDFMDETHPGVQDMACDTFLKIAQKCRSKFVTLQPGETRPFIVEMLERMHGTERMPSIIRKLQPHQVQSFYESCGCVIASQPDPTQRSNLIMKLFELPNADWQTLIYAATVHEEVLLEREKMKSFSGILRTNSRVSSSLGAPYLVQLEWIYADMLKVYKVYSTLIQRIVSTGGQHVTKTSEVRNMRAVKRDILRVLEAFIVTAPEKDREQINKSIVEPLSDVVLGDYFTSLPESREPAVLSLYSHIVAYNKGGLSDAAITLIFKSLFGCTLDMIKNNFEDFPDARINFFLLLRSVNQHNFTSLFKLDGNPAAAEAEFRVVINAIVWALKHTERNVAETGLQILLELLRNVDHSPYVGYFYRMYFKSILNDILSVLTDTFHRPGFKLHAHILMHLIGAVCSGRITEPIWDQAVQEEVSLASCSGTVAPTNALYLRNHLTTLLKAAFPNLSSTQVTEVVRNLLAGSDEKMFKGHLRDFLVQTKEFSGGDNTDLFDEEAQAKLAETQKAEAERLARTPGLVAPGVGVDDGMSGMG
jgi:exportin-1